MIGYHSYKISMFSFVPSLVILKLKNGKTSVLDIFSRVHATLQPALSTGWLVGRLVGHTLLFYMILFL